MRILSEQGLNKLSFKVVRKKKIHSLYTFHRALPSVNFDFFNRVRIAEASFNNNASASPWFIVAEQRINMEKVVKLLKKLKIKYYFLKSIQ